MVCLHLATTIPCSQVVCDWPGMLQSHESCFKVVIYVLNGTQH